MTNDELASYELFFQGQKMEATKFYISNMPFDFNTLDEIFGEMQFQELEAEYYLTTDRNTYVMKRLIILNEMWSNLYKLALIQKN